MMREKGARASLDNWYGDAGFSLVRKVFEAPMCEWLRTLSLRSHTAKITYII